MKGDHGHFVTCRVSQTVTMTQIVASSIKYSRKKWGRKKWGKKSHSRMYESINLKSTLLKWMKDGAQDVLTA